jgi:excisionase family DNA binding protein
MSFVRKADKQENEFTKPAQDEWLTAQELAPRLKLSSSTIYSLVRRGTGIPYAQPPGTKIIRFSWKSVDAWWHELEMRKAKLNFKD